MPDTPAAWLFWLFTAIVVGLVVSVAANLVSPRVKKSGEDYLQKRRLKHNEYTEKLVRLAQKINEDPVELIFYISIAMLRLAIYVVFGLVIVAIASLFEPMAILAITFFYFGYYRFIQFRNELVDLKRVYAEVKAQSNGQDTEVSSDEIFRSWVIESSKPDEVQ